MRYNYQTEKRKFDREWNETEKMLVNSGMSDEKINELRVFDLSLFNRDRAFRRNNVLLDGYRTNTDSDGNMLVSLNSDCFSVTDTYFEDDIDSWFELLDDEVMAEKITRLESYEKYIFREYYVFGKSQRQIAEDMGLTRRIIELRLQRLRSKLSE